MVFYYCILHNLKNATGIDTSSFAKTVDLAHSKSNVDKLEIDKLKNISANLNNLKSKVYKLDVDELVPVPVDLSKLKDKIPDITNLANKTTLTVVEHKLPNVSNLVKKFSITQKLMKLKRKLLIMIIVTRILLLQNLISLYQEILQQGFIPSSFYSKQYSKFIYCL